jgi:uncharacterized protein YjiS (DUF1127 family)
MVFKISLPFHDLARALAQLMPSGQVKDKRLQQGREELLQMSARELNDLGISRGDIPALYEEPQAWRRDRR